jgi:hypothetical protein
MNASFLKPSGRCYPPVPVRSTACLTTLLLAGSLASPAAAASADAELLATALIVFQPLPDQMPGAEQDTACRDRVGQGALF